MPNLVGTGLNQVPTNSMLGGLAYQSPDYASIENLDLKYISQINAETADTAVDVFVYDTSRDTDGGAWRKRTQHTSWYNETLNTTTRGSRREFPSVAIIVAEATQVTIYDGDDPDLPMWMVFPSNGYLSWASGSPTTISSVSMLNAILVVGVSNGRGNTLSDFIKDDTRYLYGDGAYYNPTDRTIKGRSTSVDGSGSAYTAGGDGYVIADNAINDIAMTVLPNAPIDEVTGLQVPTIAVGTDGGVSIIKDDGSVYDSSDTNSYGTMEFNGQRLISSRNTNQVRFFISQEMRTIDADGFSLYESYTLDTAGYPRLLTDSGYGLVSKHSSFAARAGSLGVTLWDWDPSNTNEYQDFQTESSIAHISTTYNTGWQFGDCKGAFLSDTDATNVTGTELVTNGTFDSNVNNWTADTNGVITHNTGSGGRMQLESTSGGGQRAYQDITTVIGETYVVSTDTTDSGSTTPLIYVDSVLQVQPTNGYEGSMSHTFTATGTTTRIGVGWNGPNTGYYDNISVRKAELDRSVNAKGLQVFGTVTKSAVATGSELVAYGPFSTSNRLQQPYNSDLDFGTGEFSVMLWFKSTASNSQQFVRKGDPSTDIGCFESYITNVGGNGNIRFVIKHTDGSSNSVLNAGTTGWNDGIWHHYVAVRRSDGSMELYLDGALSNNTTSTYSVTNASSILDIGSVGSLANGASDTYLSLVRISGSAPSAEQIKKIYEDEKFLFQENAACTLYGSSDAVTALAYDEKTELLHVGTSSGRSDFNGLRRINNTTTAVTTAISAYDGSIAQQ